MMGRSYSNCLWVVAVAAWLTLALATHTALAQDGSCHPKTECGPGVPELVPDTPTTDRVCGSDSVTALFNVSRYAQATYLDEDKHVRLYWDVDFTGAYNESTITFAVVAQTTGWVGIGFNSLPSMRGADIVIGGVTDDGAPYFTDRHATDFARPIYDASQDAVLLAAIETEHFTILEFERRLATCDDNDFNIGHGTTRILWAMGPSDADPADDNTILYHGADHKSRGSRSVNLLAPVTSSIPSDIADSLEFDIKMEDTQVEPVRTSYRCRAFALPDVDTKHHILSWEAVVQPINKARVHHILAYECQRDLKSQHFEFEDECGENMPNILEECRSSPPIAAWAVGQDPVYLPEEAGLPMGPGDGNARYVLMEVHYDNPDLESFTDSSGLRFHYTPNLRQYDAAILETGVYPTREMIIPPNQEAFVYNGYCPTQCTSLLPHNLTVVASLLHQHLTGISVRSRHIRNGVELPHINANPTYDFNYQTFDVLENPVTIMPGDEIITECTFRTDNTQRELLEGLGYDASFLDNSVRGGLGTDNEMCLNYLLYYPKIQASRCWSVHYAPSDVASQFEVRGEWSDELLQNYAEAIDSSIQVSECPDFIGFIPPYVHQPLPAVETGCTEPAEYTTFDPRTCTDNDADLSVVCDYYTLISGCNTCEEVADLCNDGLLAPIAQFFCPQTCGAFPCEVSRREEALEKQPAIEAFENRNRRSSSRSSSSHAVKNNRREEGDGRVVTSINYCGEDEYFIAQSQSGGTSAETGTSTATIVGVFCGVFVGVLLLGIVAMRFMVRQAVPLERLE